MGKVIMASLGTEPAVDTSIHVNLKARTGLALQDTVYDLLYIFGSKSLNAFV